MSKNTITKFQNMIKDNFNELEIEVILDHITLKCIEGMIEDNMYDGDIKNKIIDIIQDWHKDK